MKRFRKTLAVILAAATVASCTGVTALADDPLTGPVSLSASSGNAESEATDPGATESGTTGSDATGSSTTESGTTGSDTTGSDTTGSGTTGSDATGSGTTGSSTTESDTTGSDTTGSSTTESGTAGSDTTGSVVAGPNAVMSNGIESDSPADAVILLLEALPTAEEIGAYQPDLGDLTPEDSGYQEAFDAAVLEYRTSLADKAQEARQAYEALSDEEKAAVPATLVDNLTAVETALGTETREDTIAEIDSTPYTDLTEFIRAFNALTGTHTVTLYTSLTLPSYTPAAGAASPSMGENALFVQKDADITLELGGNTLSAEFTGLTGSTYGLAYVIRNEGTLTIRNGTVSASTNYGCTATIKNVSGASLTAENLTLSSAGGNALQNQANATAELISGQYSTTGKFASFDNGTSVVNNLGRLIVRGGDFSTEYSAPLFQQGSENPTIEVYGGSYTSVNMALDIQLNAGTAAVYGGEFHADPSGYLAPGSFAVQNEDGSWSVSVHDGETGTASSFAQLADLLANGYKEVTIAADFAITGDLEIPQYADVIIPQGRTLSLSDNVTLTLAGYLHNNGTLDISSSNGSWIENLSRLVNQGTISGISSSVDNVYSIFTPLQLQMMHFVFADKANDSGIFTGTIRLEADLDMTGLNFSTLGGGSDLYAFGGEFDGQGHTISNLRIHSDESIVGLFAILDSAQIHDVNLENVDFHTQSGEMGVIAGESYGSNLFENITISGTYQNNGSYYCGGFLGYMGGEAGDTYTFINCHNQADITGYYNVGAFWGSSSGCKATVNMIDCSNSGNVTATGGTGAIIGGYTDSIKGTGYNFVNTGSLTVGSASAVVPQDNSQSQWVNKSCMTFLTEEPAAYLVSGSSRVPCSSLAEAFSQVQEGQTILVVQDISEPVNVTNFTVSNVTVQASGEITISGGLSISGTFDGLTLEGFRFTGSAVNATIQAADPEKDTLTFRSCDFDGVTARSNKTGVLNLINNSQKKNLVLENCTFRNIQDAAGSTQSVAVYVQNAHNVTVTGCTFDTVSGTALNLNSNTGSMVITGNTFSGWGTGATGEGRAVRISTNGGSLQFTGNVLNPAALSAESFVKITELTAGQISITRNYWAGLNPDTDLSGDGSPLAEFSQGTEPELYPYYADAALTELVYRADTTVEDALKAALDAADAALASSSDPGLSGKTLATLTDEDLTACAAGLHDLKDALGEAMTALNSKASAEQISEWLASHPEESARYEMLIKVCAVAFQVEEKATAPVSTADPSAVQATTPDGVTAPTEDQIWLAASAQIAELTGNAAVSGTAPQGLAEAAVLSTSELGSNVGVYLKVTLEDLSLAVRSDGTGTELVPESYQFDIQPMMQQLDADLNPIRGTDTAITSLNGQSVVFRLPISSKVTQRYAKVTHNGDPDRYLEILSDPDTGELYIELSSTHFSPFIVTFTNSLPTVSNNSSSGSSFTERQNEFWDEVKELLRKAEPGDTVTVNARSYDRMPYSVMKVLGEQEDVTLYIRWNGGEDIAIPSAFAVNEAQRVYYPLSYLEGMDFGVDQSTGTADKVNPATGGIAWWLEAPVSDDLGENGPVTDARLGLSTDPNGIEASADLQTANYEAEAEEETAGGISPMVLILAGAVLLAAAGAGYWYWKRRELR